jgi:predicted RND superfamily exporter protein
MVFASLALMLGFGVLVFSNFLPTMQFGLLVSLAMVGGLVGNLVLLPILLEWFAPKRFRVQTNPTAP